MKSIQVRQIVIGLTGLAGWAHVYGAQVDTKQPVDRPANLLFAVVKQNTDLLSWRVRADDVLKAMENGNGIENAQRAQEVEKAFERLDTLGRQLGVDKLPNDSVDRKRFKAVYWWKLGYKFLQNFPDSIKNIESIAQKLTLNQALSEPDVAQRDAFIVLYDKAKANKLTKYYGTQSSGKVITTGTKKNPTVQQMTIQDWLTSSDADTLVGQFQNKNKSKK